MHEHIPDSANTYIVITTDDIRSLGKVMILGGIAGLAAAVVTAFWFEATEDDRKEARKWKKEAKKIKLRREAAAREAQTS